MLVGAFVLMHRPARPRVQRAPGLPRALFNERGQTKCKTSGRSCREMENSCLSSVIPGRAKREPGISNFRVRCCASPRNDVAKARYVPSLRLLRQIRVRPAEIRRRRILADLDDAAADGAGAGEVVEQRLAVVAADGAGEFRKILGESA